MTKAIQGDKKSHPARTHVKTHKNRKREIEREYKTVFTPNPLPSQGIYTDDDSLEQPSALRYMPSTTTPAATTTISPLMRQDAELE